MKCDKIIKKLMYCNLNNTKPKVDLLIQFYKKYILKEVKEIKSQKTKKMQHIIRKSVYLHKNNIVPSIDHVIDFYKIINDSEQNIKGFGGN